jgi:hypothetical protein
LVEIRIVTLSVTDRPFILELGSLAGFGGKSDPCFRLLNMRSREL